MKWKDRFNRKYMQISLYVIFTAIIIYCLSLIARSAPLIATEVVERFRWLIRVVKPVIFGFVFAYLLDPVVEFFEKEYSKLRSMKIFRWLKAPRTWAAVTAVLLVLAAAAGLISLLAFSVTNQLRLANFEDIKTLSEGYVANLNSFYETILSKLNQMDIQSDEIQKYVNDASKYIFDLVKGLANSVLMSITNISGYLTTIIFSLIIGFYFMIDGRMFISYIKKVSRALFSESTNAKIAKSLRDLDEVFSGYIRGQLADAMLMMVIISVSLSIVGIKFAIVIGVFAGIGNLIPYFGPIVAYFSTTIVCLINGEKINTWVIAMIVLLVVQAVDGNVIGPKLLSRSIKIHPLIIIVSLIFGSAIGGFLGMLLAVPVGAYIKLVFVRFINHRIERKEEIILSETSATERNAVKRTIK